MSRSVFALSMICKKYALQTALWDGNNNITYREFHDLIVKAATGLKKVGIKKGDRVALLVENSVYLPLLLFALVSLGAVAVPVNFRFPPKQINEMLHSINCRRILVSKKYIRKISARSLKVIQIEKFISDLRKIDPTGETINLKLDQAATIIFTSGSTGYPKAALLTIGNHYYNALGSNENIRLKPGDRWLLVLPLFHVGGLAILFRTFLSGATSVLMSGNESLTKIITEQNITHLSLVPTQLYRLLAEKRTPKFLNHLKAILLGGSPAADALITQASRAHLPLYLTYGLTEMASQVTTTNRLIYIGKLNFHNAGKVLKYRRLKINPDGEILVKGHTLFRGYVGKQRIYKPLDPQGWFHTRDLGKMDSRGNLVVLGRKDNMFISGGENIYPEEIERYLKEINGISDAVVVPVPDKEFGQRPVAFVKIVRGKKIAPKKIQMYLQKKTARFKIPEIYFPWPEDYMDLKPNRGKFETLACGLILKFE